ncbi:hypothetical protein YC2023_020419 [Brassica napus]
MGIMETGTVSGNLPSKETFVVHYPGYPSSITRALENESTGSSFVQANCSFPLSASKTTSLNDSGVERTAPNQRRELILKNYFGERKQIESLSEFFSSCVLHFGSDYMSRTDNLQSFRVILSSILCSDVWTNEEITAEISLVKEEILVFASDTIQNISTIQIWISKISHCLSTEHKHNLCISIDKLKAVQEIKCPQLDTSSNSLTASVCQYISLVKSMFATISKQLVKHISSETFQRNSLTKVYFKKIQRSCQEADS